MPEGGDIPPIKPNAPVKPPVKPKPAPPVDDGEDDQTQD
jgi:hypothetical protein